MSRRGPRGTHGPEYSGLPRYEENDLNTLEGTQQASRTFSAPVTKENSQVDDGLLRHHQEPLALRGGAGRRPRNGPDIGYGAATRDFQRHYGGGARPPQWGASFRADGTGELQTYYQSLGENAQAHTARKHDNKKQFIHLIGKILLRWLASFILSVLMVVCFYQYEKVKILDRDSRRWFNALSTGLYLTLGLNLAASLKGMATLVRWKLLARKRHQLDEVDFILGIHSLIKCFRYGIHISRRRPWTALACLGWIGVNTVGRLSVALTGLTYSYDSANATALHKGTVNVTSWDSFSELDPFSRARTPTSSAERHAAHLYGLFSVIFTYQDFTKPGADYDLNMPFKNPIEVDDNNTYYYYFREYNPDTSMTHGVLAHKSSRYISANSKCESHPLIQGQRGDSSTVVYTNDGVEHTLHNISDLYGLENYPQHASASIKVGTAHALQRPPKGVFACKRVFLDIRRVHKETDSPNFMLVKEYGPSATVWINPRSDLERNKEWDCGPRCAAIAALQFVDSNSDEDGWFYDCEVTVSKVQGATEKVHELSDFTAEIAAGAIGLEGYSTGPDQWEYIRYPPESPWSNFGVSNDEDSNYMAKLANRFAIGTIAAKDLSYLYGQHSTVQTEGMVAWVGVLLKIKWKYLLLILGTILAAQLVMGFAAVAYANTVFCKDDSYLSIARLLRPIVERLGPTGCAMTGKDISHTLRQFMVYGVRSDDSGIRHHLDIGEDIEPRNFFPEGWYDGEIKSGLETQSDDVFWDAKESPNVGLRQRKIPVLLRKRLAVRRKFRLR